MRNGGHVSLKVKRPALGKSTGPFGRLIVVSQRPCNLTESVIAVKESPSFEHDEDR